MTIPAIHAVMKHARFVHISIRGIKVMANSVRLGAMDRQTPTNIYNVPKLENPHNA